jgi:uncharacterized protein (DUF885 family)
LFFQLIGFYSFNLLRACRLVVDTGIHAMGWTRQQAVDYLLANSALSKDLVEQEIDRYITWPGQATAYKIGERHIKRLRKTMEQDLGSKFDLKKFHRNLLNCYGPLELLDECVKSASRLQLSSPKKRQTTGNGSSGFKNNLFVILTTLVIGSVFK